MTHHVTRMTIANTTNRSFPRPTIGLLLVLLTSTVLCVRIPLCSQAPNQAFGADDSSTAKPCNTETCGPTRALGLLKPSDPVPLDEGFRDPPPICRVQCWWQCHGSAFTKEEITRELEEFKAQGFGGVAVKDTTNMPRDAQTQHIADIDYMSPKWVDMFAHIVNECKRLGLICRTRLGSGWNAGGPWVKPEMASQVMAFAQSKPIVGPTTFSGAIPLAEDGSPILPALRNDNAYVLAIRQPDKRVVNLTDQVTDERKLNWDVPEGSWTLVSFYSKPDAHNVASCSTSGRGHHHDHCSNAGTDLMIENVAEPILAKLGSFENTAFDGFNLDSWELGKPTWTPRFRQEFTKRHGYDPVPHLPVLMHVNDDRYSSAKTNSALGEQDQRFLFDLRTTIGELVVETHYARISRWCRQHGVVLEAEAGGPHTIPNEPLESQGCVDIPMGEFWVGSWTFVRPTASAAHTYGRRLVSLESFTDTSKHFRVRPSELKPRVDEAFLLGGNYLNIAVTDYSPQEAGLPGWVHAAGPHLNHCETWWSMSRPFFDYLARCCFLLQSGRNVAQVAYYQPLRTPTGLWRFPDNRDHLDKDPKQFAYDLINDDLIQNQMRVEDGQVVLRSGASYPVLYIQSPESGIMPLATVSKIRNLLADGATVVWSGPKPTKCPTLTDYPRCDAQLKSVVGELFANPRLITFEKHDLASLVPIVEKSTAPPAWKTIGDAPIRFVHRRTPDADIFFLVNRAPNDVNATITFRVDERTPELWDPSTGKILPVSYQETAEDVEVRMQMPELNSAFIVFRKGGIAGSSTTAKTPRTETTATEELTIAGPWQLDFPEGKGAPPKATFEQLKSWTDADEQGIRDFSGTAIYRTTFACPATLVKQGTRVALDLGQVAEVCEVWLNGQRLGVGWHGPYRFDATDALKPGENELEIRVANLWLNRVRADAQLPPEQRITRIVPTSWYDRCRKSKPLKSGLLGPVKLQLATAP